jgi:hypothetical protein
MERNNIMSKKTAIAAAVALMLSAGAAQAANLGTNGDFESGAFDGSWIVFPNAGTTSIVNPGSDASGPASSWAGEAEALVPTGATMKYANVGAGLLAPGQAFTVDFDWKGTNGIGGVVDIRVFSEQSAGGVSKTDILAGGTGAGLTADWTNFGLVNLIAGSDVSGGVTVEFTAICGGAIGCFSNMAIDNVSVTADLAPVPVPAAAWLFGSALLGLGGLARKKRAA